jgi:gluconolactonase
MHIPNERVYRYDLETNHLELLIDTGQSPNGLALNEQEDKLYVAMTRGNGVWRLPLTADGIVSKVGVFLQLSGGLSGPDGLVLDQSGGLWIAHAGNGCVWVFTRAGEPTFRVKGTTRMTTTNLAFGGLDNSELFITESDTGNILRAQVGVAGQPMFSHL